jgi:hypothetical protein
MLRFHLPLVEPDVRISRIRLSDGIRGDGSRPGGSIAAAFAGPLVPSAVAESLLEVVGNMATLPTLDRFRDAPEVRPLPSTGITRLPRYYKPVRHPRRPGLSLTGVRLGNESPPSRVSRVASDPHVQTCRRHYPGGTMDPAIARAPA